MAKKDSEIFEDFFEQAPDLLLIGELSPKNPEKPFENYRPNASMLNVLGYSLEEFRQLTPADFIPEHDLEEFQKVFLGLQNGIPANRFRHHVLTKDKSEIFVEVNAKPQGGYYFLSMRDLTSVESEAQKVSASHELEELKGQGYFQVLDYESGKMMISSKAREVLKMGSNPDYSMQEFLGLFTKEDREYFSEQLLEASRSSFKFSHIFKLPASVARHSLQNIYIEVALRSRIDSKGKSNIYGTVEDVSSQYNNEVLFRALLEHIPLAIFCKSYSNSPDAQFIFANQSYLKMTNRTEEEVIGKSQPEVSQNSLVARNLINNDRELLSSGEAYREFHETIHVNDEVRYLHTWKVRLDENTVLGMSLDETERVKMEKDMDLERARSLESARLASLGEMAGGVAHEINNPLSILKFAVHGLKKSLDRADSSQDIDDLRNKMSPYLEKSDNTINRIAKIITGLRTFAREGKADPLESILLSELVEDTMEFSKMRLKSIGVTLNISIPEGFRLFGRSVPLSQVLLNLINNAKDAIEDTENPWIELKAIDVAGRKIIRVTDSGKGIPESLKNKIFNPFYTTKGPQKGTGLGLSISRGLIQEMGGKFYYDEKSENTSFVISLPAEVQESSDEEEPAA